MILYVVSDDMKKEKIEEIFEKHLNVPRMNIRELYKILEYMKENFDVKYHAKGRAKHATIEHEIFSW